MSHPPENDGNVKNEKKTPVCISPIDYAERFFEYSEQRQEMFYDHDMVCYATEAIDIFRVNNMLDLVRKVHYVCGLKRTPCFFKGFTSVDTWEWAMNNFLKSFPWMTEEACEFYKERLDNDLSPLARARYCYAICCYDPSARGTLLKESGNLFIEMTINILQNSGEIGVGIATAKEMHLGLSILRQASLNDDVKVSVDRLLTELEAGFKRHKIAFLTSFIENLSSFVEFAREDLVMKIAQGVAEKVDKVENSGEERCLEAIISWRLSSLDPLKRELHSKLAQYFEDLAKKQEPSFSAHHFLIKAIPHAIKSGDKERADNLLKQAEDCLKGADIPPTIVMVERKKEMLEEIYVPLAEDYRNHILLLRLVSFSVGDIVNKVKAESSCEDGAPIMRKLLSTMRIEGQTAVHSDEGGEKDIVESLIRIGVVSLETFSTGLHFYLSKGWIEKKDIYGIFASSSFLQTTPFIYEMELAYNLGMKQSALHLAIPCIERLCQEILVAHSQSTTYLDDDGDTQVYVLSSLLTRLVKNNILTEMEKRFVLVQLDKEGRNIRNKVCHGLVRYDETAGSDYCFCVLILLFLLVKWHLFKSKEMEEKQKEVDEC